MNIKKLIYAGHAICLIFALTLIQGCSIFVSDKAYEAEKAMWEAKGKASEAWAKTANRPMVTLTTPSGDILTVNNPTLPPPMIVTGEPNAFVQGADVVLNSWLAKMFGGGYLADKILSNMQGNYTTGDGSPINVTRDSGNTATITTRHTEGDSSGISEEKHIGSDIVSTPTDNRTNYENSTATPTVVDQPNPVLVPTTIVRPEVVIQPEPIIVPITTTVP